MVLPGVDEQGRKPEKPREKSLPSSILIPKSLQWEHHQPGTPISPGREPGSLRRRASSFRGLVYFFSSLIKPFSNKLGPWTQQSCHPSAYYLWIQPVFSNIAFIPLFAPTIWPASRLYVFHFLVLYSLNSSTVGYPATQTIQVLLNLPLCLQINADDTSPPTFNEVEATLKATCQYLYDGINTLIHRTTTNNDGLLWRDFLDAYNAIPWLEGYVHRVDTNV